jgi:hypothetical protein
MNRNKALAGVVVALAVTGVLGGAPVASAEGPMCDKQVTQRVHDAHETVEERGDGTPAQPATDLASGVVHDSELVTCLLPV